MTSCFQIDDVIQQLISHSDDSDIKVQWENQKYEFVKWQLSKKVDKIEVGDKLDVRDTGYIWCSASVTMIVESVGNDPILVIHYDNWNRWYDEFLPISSPRIARFGYYTSRDDIPKYKMKPIEPQRDQSSSKNQMQAFIINRICNPSDGLKSQPKLNIKEKKQSNSELPNSATDEEKKRHENQNIGDQIEEKLEEFLNKYQDSNPMNGNHEISGVIRKQGGNQSDELDDSYQAMIELRNIQQIQQVIQHPVFLRGNLNVLGAVGSGGQNIANALLGQPAQLIPTPLQPTQVNERQPTISI